MLTPTAIYNLLCRYFGCALGCGLLLVVLAPLLALAATPTVSISALWASDGVSPDRRCGSSTAQRPCEHPPSLLTPQLTALAPSPAAASPIASPPSTAPVSPKVDSIANGQQPGSPVNHWRQGFILLTALIACGWFWRYWRTR